MTIEHFVPQKHDPTRADDYSNCFYVCRYCNGSRATKPTTGKRGHRLLDPTSAVWKDHFFRQGERLRPHSGDKDAGYTHSTYRLDDPRKVKLRALRREHIERCLRTIREAPGQHQALLELAEKLERDGTVAGARKLREIAESHRKNIAQAKKELGRYRAVPNDCGNQCCCKLPALTLPRAVHEQVQHV